MSNILSLVPPIAYVVSIDAQNGISRLCHALYRNKESFVSELTEFPTLSITCPDNASKIMTLLDEHMWINGSVSSTNIGTRYPAINDTKFTLISYELSSSACALFSFGNNTTLSNGDFFLDINFTDGNDLTAKVGLSFTLQLSAISSEVKWWEDLVLSLISEFIGIAVTIFVIDRLLEYRKERSLATTRKIVLGRIRIHVARLAFVIVENEKIIVSTQPESAVVKELVSDLNDELKALENIVSTYADLLVVELRNMTMALCEFGYSLTRSLRYNHPIEDRRQCLRDIVEPMLIIAQRVNGDLFNNIQKLAERLH